MRKFDALEHRITNQVEKSITDKVRDLTWEKIGCKVIYDADWKVLAEIKVQLEEELVEQV